MQAAVPIVHNVNRETDARDPDMLARSPMSAKPALPAMTPAEFRATLARLGFAGDARENDAGISACARLFGAEVRTAQNWAAKGPPAGIVVALRIMASQRLTAGDVAEILERAAKRR